MSDLPSRNPLPHGIAEEPLLLELDKKLSDLVKNIDILEAVKPLNYQQEKKQFFDCHFSSPPQFKYNEHNLDLFAFKRSLFNLPVDQLKDDDLRCLYMSVIDSYVDKAEQYKSIGTSDFLYDSLRYYGEPCEKDIRNAQFVLHLPGDYEENAAPLRNAEVIKNVLEGMVVEQGYTCQIEFDDSMIANALVSGTRIRINSNAQIPDAEINALAHHEIGVHLVTSLNGRLQPLHVLSLGCPLNTMTQEGLAILSEYLSGYLSIKRLKILALRVIAVKSMMEEKNFRNTFLMLKEAYQVNDEMAFTITARVYRGGGFSKDFLYLRGFRLILNAYEKEANFHHLLAGKTSLDFLPTISRLIEKGILIAPQYITPAFKTPIENEAARTFVAHAIR